MQPSVIFTMKMCTKGDVQNRSQRSDRLNYGQSDPSGRVEGNFRWPGSDLK